MRAAFVLMLVLTSCVHSVSPELERLRQGSLMHSWGSVLMMAGFGGGIGTGISAPSLWEDQKGPVIVGALVSAGLLVGGAALMRSGDKMFAPEDPEGDVEPRREPVRTSTPAAWKRPGTR